MRERESGVLEREGGGAEQKRELSDEEDHRPSVGLYYIVLGT